MKILLPLLLAIFTAAQGQVVPTKSKKEEPIPFRCDRMAMDGKNYSVSCQGNVLIKYDTLLLCCDTFSARANKDWEWQTLDCKGRVRAYMDDRWLWGDEGRYLVGDEKLEISGDPLLKQGRSWFTGSKVEVYSKTQTVQLIKPRGTLARDVDTGKRPKVNAKKLPATCPIPFRSAEINNLPTDGHSDE